MYFWRCLVYCLFFFYIIFSFYFLFFVPSISSVLWSKVLFAWIRDIFITEVVKCAILFVIVSMDKFVTYEVVFSCRRKQGTADGRQTRCGFDVCLEPSDSLYDLCALDSHKYWSGGNESWSKSDVSELTSGCSPASLEEKYKEGFPENKLEHLHPWCY